MVSPDSCLDGWVINPYARPPRFAAAEASNLDDNLDETTVETIQEMGIQSQNRNGSVQGCKKRATRAKPVNPYRQSPMPGGTIFIPWQHCRICKVERHKQQGKNVSIRGALEIPKQRESLQDSSL
jgi:hypothetical protein